MLWGHQLPTSTEEGLVYHGHWNADRYTDLVLWLGNCNDRLKRICRTDQQIRDNAQQDVIIADMIAQHFHGKHPKAPEAISIEVADLEVSRLRVRDHLWDEAMKTRATVIGPNGKIPVRSWDQLREWTRSAPHMLLRLAGTGHVPHPPAYLIAPEPPKTSDRTERIASQPTELENTFA